MILDARERSRAIDVLGSFCVSAPAGSGKTELLIQRYLALLSRVERPEQVLAITFTRKAAAEMKERVLDALQAAREGRDCDTPHQRVTRELALAALSADSEFDWHLLRDMSRLNIKTIDGFCGSLTRQMPVLSEFGGQARLLDDADALYQEAVVNLFGQLDSRNPVTPDLEALMLHFDNNWERLRDLLTAMLARRDQWRSYVGVHRAPDESQAYLEATVQSLVADNLQTLAVQLSPYSSELLELQQYAAGNLGSVLPLHFPSSSPDEVAAWRSIRELLLTKTGGWRKSVNVNNGFPAGKGLAQERKEQLKQVIADLSEIAGLLDALDALQYLPQIETDSASWQLLVHLSRLLPVLAAELLLVFQQHGAVDHTQVALSALQALGDDDAPTELALRLDYQIEHILVDEFQDTSINQYELLRCLTRGWGEYNAANPQAPRTILVVGDGMQSIYGFRGANVGLFLKARNEGFNGVVLQPAQLVSNFRSQEGIVSWVNETFVNAFPAHDDVNNGQVSYTAASAVREAGDAPAVCLHAFQAGEGAAQEVEFVCEQIAAFVQTSPEQTLAVLARTRSHLQDIIAGLRQRGIAHNAQDMDSLATSALVIDIMTLCRALANKSDRLAWMALLRAPWCGLSLADLLQIVQNSEAGHATPVWNGLHEAAVVASLSEDGRLRLARLLPVMEWAEIRRDRLALRVWVEQVWLRLAGPALAAHEHQLQDAEAFFQLLEQADTEGIGLDLDWLEQRLSKRFVSGGEVTSAVQLMTLHKAKGLEFDCVIIPQLAKQPRADERPLLLWDEHSSHSGDRQFLLAADDHSASGEPTLYNFLQQQRKTKTLLESTRLLYVGATRAIKRLVMTATLNYDDTKDAFKPPSSRSLLSPVWEAFSAAMQVHELPAVPLSSAATGPQSSAHVRLALDSPVLLATTANGADPASANERVMDIGTNIPPRAANLDERVTGTVVHRALEELSWQAQLSSCVEQDARQRWQVALQQQGLFGAALDAALENVVASIGKALAHDSPGRWLLDSGHSEARSEWELTWVAADGRVQNLVIDRTFIDKETQVRWLVDYKNSRPLPDEDLATFLAREEATYRVQLERYRDALQAMENRPIRVALYFAALGYLHPVVALSSADLPDD